MKNHMIKNHSNSSSRNSGPCGIAVYTNANFHLAIKAMTVFLSRLSISFYQF